LKKTFIKEIHSKKFLQNLEMRPKILSFTVDSPLHPDYLLFELRGLLCSIEDFLLKNLRMGVTKGEEANSILFKNNFCRFKQKISSICFCDETEKKIIILGDLSLFF